VKRHAYYLTYYIEFCDLSTLKVTLNIKNSYVGKIDLFLEKYTLSLPEHPRIELSQYKKLTIL
jgi:hypothetical protein